MAPAIDFSVLLPLQDARATGDACLQAWIDQSFSAERYELVILAPGIDRELELRWKGRLRRHDLWIEHESDNEYDLFNLGARRANGRFLFLTEAHCIPERDCLEAMHGHLQSTGDVGARGRTLGEPRGALGQLEHAVFDDALRQGEELSHWDKVLIHSFTITPEAYRQAGGLDPALGDFSPWALSIALWEKGHRLGFTPHCKVRHIYTGELGETAEYVRGFLRGEIAFRARAGEVADRYLRESREWTERWKYAPPGRAARLRGAAAAWRTDPWRMTAVAAPLLSAISGPTALLLAKRIQVSLAKAEVLVRRAPNARLAAYRRFWHAAARLGAVEWLVANPPGDPPQPQVRLDYDLTAGDGPRMIGVDVVEEWEGHRFRWSEPLGLVEVSLPEGTELEGRLEILPIREHPPPGLRIVHGGDAIPQSSYRYEPGAVRFPVRGSGARWLSFACQPLRPRRHGSTDHRDLGLPLVGLRFR